MSDLYAADNVPENGVGSGNRTRDNHVGNVMLYQLSYIHMEHVEVVETSYSAWKADVLPLNYTCMVGRVGIGPTTPSSSG